MKNSDNSARTLLRKRRWKRQDKLFADPFGKLSKPQEGTCLCCFPGRQLNLKTIEEAKVALSMKNLEIV